MPLVLSRERRYRRSREQTQRGEHGYRVIEDLVSGAFRATEILLAWVVRLIPFAVFGVVAKTIGEQGFAPLKGLAVYVGVALLGLAIFNHFKSLFAEIL